MKSLFFLFSSFFLLGSSVWQTDFQKAQTEATAQKKYILLNFSGSDWCGPCIKLKKEILDSEEFLQYADEKLVLVRADFPRLKKNRLSPEQTKQNEALAEKYNSEGKFPLTVLIDANGKAIKSWEGYESSMSILTLKHDIHLIVNAK
jgi:thioredoxin-related protein